MGSPALPQPAKRRAVAVREVRVAQPTERVEAAPLWRQAVVAAAGALVALAEPAGQLRVAAAR
ncbi:hypothetical protein ASC68_25940 [Devosia sp. Root105]|nr:hypothetical protein ASC68_25940 [Devosia sp. Root105]